MKRALITGIYGQDGSYIAEQLIEDGYEVYGIARDKLSSQSLCNKELLSGKGIRLYVSNVDLYDYEKVRECIKRIMPDEIYHVAAIHNSASHAIEGAERIVFEKNIKATFNILEACAENSMNTRVVTAGSCLMYDASDTNRQNENTPFKSSSFYGIAKITENMLVQKYRTMGLYACTAILYNHESSRRSENFVTKKIIQNMMRIKLGALDKFSLGNLEVFKDWGHASDYARGMRLMLCQNKPTDYILSSGTLHTIRDFCDECSKQLGISDWEKHIEINESMIARKITNTLFGDSSKAVNELNWKADFSFESLIDEMIKNTKI